MTAIQPDIQIKSYLMCSYYKTQVVLVKELAHFVSSKCEADPPVVITEPNDILGVIWVRGKIFRE